jgi:hypothetical protein
LERFRNIQTPLGVLTHPKIQLLGKGVVEHGLTVGGRIVVENQRLFLELAVKTGPVFPGFEDSKIKALAIVGAEEVPVPFFTDGIRTIHSASLQPGHL